MSLKDELLGRAVPGFGIVLPAGWEEFRPDAQAEAALVARAGARLKPAHRPDLYGQLRAQLHRAMEDLRRRDGIALYLQTDAPEGLVMPMSITATRVRAQPGMSLDSQVVSLIRDHGAHPLGGDSSMLRWEKDDVQTIGADRAATHTLAYLTPVPGSARREAVQFTTVIAHPIDISPEDDVVRSLTAVSDTIISTFQWVPA
ncbi:hypothetical protein WDJ51_06920 [Rathayibacter sp. YIM 133350]|uniref:hypothetical protein n=1 Tax=Rathayibacter sp. YIM 133350 TaxID=3131992 RepID=UPI00307F8B60